MNEVQNLPNGWVKVAIEDLFDLLEDGRTLHQGWSPQCEKAPSQDEDEWGVLKTTAVQPGAFLPEQNKRLPVNLIPRPQTEVKVGDILLTCAGPRSRCGIACLVRTARKKLMMSGKMYRFRVPEALFEARYLEAFLQTAAARDAIDRMKTGGSDSGLNLTHDRFRRLEVSVAPLNEQRRIVDAYEELISDLDAGVAALEQVLEKLKVYRAAVLKAAVEGTLTAEWRMQHPRIESASNLLKRILTERRRRWEEEQLRKFKEKGSEPPKNWKAKYKEPLAPDTDDLPPLPGGWCWTSLGQAFSVHVGATPSREKKAYWNGDIPWVASGEVQFCRILGTRERITAEGLANTSTQLNPAGSVILNMIGEGKTRGKAGILEIAACNNQNCAAIWVSNTPISTQFVYFWLLFRYEQTRQLGYGNNQPALNKSIVEQIELPLPPLAEQEAIVEAVEDQLSVIDHLEADIDANVTGTQALRQSILRHAFSGRLVPQVPTDEPASELLKRIAAEREQRTREAAVAKRLKESQPRKATKAGARRKAGRAVKGNNNGRVADR